MDSSRSFKFRRLVDSVVIARDFQSTATVWSNQPATLELGVHQLRSPTPETPIQQIDILDSIPFRTRPSDRLLVCHPLIHYSSHSPGQSHTSHLSSHLLWYLHSRLNALNLSRWDSGRASKEELRARRVSWEVVNTALMRRLDGTEGERGVDGVFRTAPASTLRMVERLSDATSIRETGEVREGMDDPTGYEGGSKNKRRYSGAGERRQAKLNKGAVFTEGNWESCREDHLESIEKQGRARVAWSGRGKVRRAGQAQNASNSLLFDGVALASKLDQGELSLRDDRKSEWARCAHLIRFSEAICPAPEQLLEVKTREPADIWDVLCPGQHSDK